jgi:hypothetical protein
MSTPTEFALFLALPIELRDYIYTFCIPRCRFGAPKSYIIDLDSPCWRECTCTRHALLSTCRESRKVVLKHIGASHTLELSAGRWYGAHPVDDWICAVDPSLLASFRRVVLWGSRTSYLVHVELGDNFRVTLSRINKANFDPETTREAFERKVTPIYESLPLVNGRRPLTKPALYKILRAIGRATVTVST